LKNDSPQQETLLKHAGSQSEAAYSRSRQGFPCIPDTPLYQSCIPMFYNAIGGCCNLTGQLTISKSILKNEYQATPSQHLGPNREKESAGTGYHGAGVCALP